MLERIKYILFIAILLITIFSNNNAYAACDEKDLYCSIPGGTRRVNGVDVKRDCWQYKYKMDCARNSKNDCNKIDHDNCAMVAEDCISNEEEGGLKYCGNLKRKFACEREISWEEERTELIKEGDNVDGKDLLCAALCLDGNCDAVKKANMEEDKDLTKAVAMLNALKDAKKGIVGDDLINVFKGESEHCDKKLWGYTNCCTKMGGWGKMLGAGCPPEAKNLAKKRKEKKCVEIGTYCKTKVPVFGCVIRRTTFCCYDSIIAKIINQEAKKQLGRNNGDAENPSCSGLNKEDLENIDLSNVDFTEFYEEIVVPNINIPNIQIDAKSNADSADEIAKRAANMPAERKGFSKIVDEKVEKEGTEINKEDKKEAELKKLEDEENRWRYLDEDWKKAATNLVKLHEKNIEEYTKSGNAPELVKEWKVSLEKTQNELKEHEEEEKMLIKKREELEKNNMDQ